MQALLDPVPGKDPETNESGLNKERQQGFKGQWRTKDVPHETGVVRPVHPKLEFLNQPGNDTDCETQHKDIAPELRHLLI